MWPVSRANLKLDRSETKSLFAKRYVEIADGAVFVHILLYEKAHTVESSFFDASMSVRRPVRNGTAVVRTRRIVFRQVFTRARPVDDNTVSWKARGARRGRLRGTSENQNEKDERRTTFIKPDV